MPFFFLNNNNDKGATCHGHTNSRLRQSTDEEATTKKVTNVELDMMRIETWEVGRDEMRNLNARNNTRA